MSNPTTVTVTGATGIDLGDKTSRLCVLDANGDVIEESTLVTKEAPFRNRFAGMASTRIAIEAGTHSPWVSRLLKTLGHEVIVANPRKLRLIYENEKKDDRVDAKYLARVARLDPELLSPVEHCTAQCQADRAVLEARDALVRARAQLVNQARGLVKAFGGRLPASSTDAFPHACINDIPDALKPAVRPLVQTIAALTKKIRAYDKAIDSLASKRYQVTAVLTQVPGVGNLTALAYILAIGDPHRFSKSRRVGSYIGLCPRKSESGALKPELRITKAGNGYVRRLLVQSAQYTLGPFGPDSDLRRWGLELAARGKKSAKKRAVIAVARKLAVLLHRLWLTREDYIPLRAGA